MALIPFVNIVLLSTHITCLLLTHVQERIKRLGSDFTFISVFGDLSICSYGGWSDSLLPVRKS